MFERDMLDNDEEKTKTSFIQTIGVTRLIHACQALRDH